MFAQMMKSMVPSSTLKTKVNMGIMRTQCSILNDIEVHLTMKKMSAPPFDIFSSFIVSTVFQLLDIQAYQGFVYLYSHNAFINTWAPLLFLSLSRLYDILLLLRFTMVFAFFGATFFNLTLSQPYHNNHIIVVVVVIICLFFIFLHGLPCIELVIFLVFVWFFMRFFTQISFYAISLDSHFLFISFQDYKISYLSFKFQHKQGLKTSLG